MPVNNLDGHRPVGRRRAAIFVALLVAQVMNVACSFAPPQLTLPEWFEPTARWRHTLNMTRLDLTITLTDYRKLFGPGHYREFAVALPKTSDDIVAAIDSALAASGRAASKKEIRRVLENEREVQWTLRDKRVIAMVYLSRVDPSRSDVPAFVLLFEPK